MKKATSIILLALALVAGLTQCKKNNDTNITDNEGEKQHITLDVKQGGNAKLDVDPPHVVFETGDQILVASNGVYVGTLAYNGTNFDGDIEGATENQRLYFYLMGNVTPAETLTKGTTTSCSVSISDQTTNKPVIACAPSEEDFGTTNNFTSTLRNKCALVKFSVTTSSSSATCIKGFNNKVEVSFAGEGSFINSQDGDGEGEGIITLPAGSGEKWAILLPQGEMEAGDDGSAFSADGYYSGTVGEVPTIDNNGYLTYGIPVTVTTYAFPAGALSGKFSVSATKQVRFSKGNLQYQASTNTWRFAEHQYDYVGDATNGNVYVGEVKCNNANISSTYSGWIDLFGWGTSGFNHNNAAYQPWATSTTSSDYYAYGSATKNLYDAKDDDSMKGQADWGYNTITNGGNQENSGWRTLTNDEWGYIFNTRTNAGSKYGHSKVNNVNGMILLPDDWTLPEGVSFTSGNSNWANVYNADQWAKMEANGAVFLPAAGSRQTNIIAVGADGNYWLSSYLDSDCAYLIYFVKNEVNWQANRDPRWAGSSVRLVRDAE